MRLAMCTLGCKVNTYEAQSVLEKLKDQGYEEVDFKEKADVYVIFTCAVTNTAASKSRKKIHQAIRQNPDAVVCVVGCYVQINANELAKDEHIDILVGSASKAMIPQLIEEALEEKKQIVRIEDVSVAPAFETLTLNRFEHQTRAFLKIQDGCNQFCSYCIIPYARGRERCMEPSLVVEEARRLSEHHKEIVLTGIHTGRYGRTDGMTLAKLIRMILDDCPKLERIRISSIEITEIDEELIDLIANEKRVARHLHIPLQSGCDETLKRMNRPYTTEEFLRKVEYIRQCVPDISISTDLIVGFMGESEEEYQSTLNFLKQVKFSFMHVFPFSLKAGTKAAAMSDMVADDAKKARAKECGQLSKDGYHAYKSGFVNRKLEVIIEEPDGEYCIGHASEYVPVKVKGHYEPNTMVEVLITHMTKDELYGVEVTHG